MTEPDDALDDDAIRALVLRLSRPHKSGGKVIERAAILAEAGDSTAVIAWIEAHNGAPEFLTPVASGGGLHGGRQSSAGTATGSKPLRYVLPPDALG